LLLQAVVVDVSATLYVTLELADLSHREAHPAAGDCAEEMPAALLD